MAWSFFRTITIPTVTTQTNFPMLFGGTYAYLATIANGGNVTSALGYDIAFYSDVALTTKLSFELESYNATTGAVNFWIKIPTLSTGTVIYIAYGDSGISNFIGNATGTWDSNFKGVWHFGDGVTVNVSDAIAYGSSTNTAITVGTGKIAGAGTFNGTSAILTTSDISEINSASAVTYSAWINATTLADYKIIVSKRDGTASTNRVEFCLGGGTEGVNTGLLASISAGTSATNGWTGSILSTATWYHVALVYDGTQTGNAGRLKIYFNGNSQTLTFAGTIPATTSSLLAGDPQKIGAQSTFWWNGLLDEVRISNAARSSTWIATEYTNQNSPSTWYTVGSAVSGIKSTQGIQSLRGINSITF